MPLLVVGIDGLGFDNLTQWLGRWMPYTYALTTKYYTRRIPLEIAISPRNWTLIFSGKALDWYRLYVKPVGNGRWRLIRISIKRIESTVSTTSIDVDVVIRLNLNKENRK